ncbi:MAG: hypothetical protein E7039_00255 [Lentisphaerae bacterium]|nr:hypothetical protein [Lentisphaerota bacterium]
MKIVHGFIASLLFAAAWSGSGVEFRNITVGKGDKTVEAGIVAGNMYSEVALLNPSVHRAMIKHEEFGLYMPSKDSDNRSTYDEEKAKIRMFFKPGLRTWSAKGRRSYLVGEDRWSVEKSGDVVKYFRNWKRNNNKIASEVRICMDEKKAEFIVEGIFTNKGRSDCAVEFSPQFTFLREADPVLLIPRKYSDYINGNQKYFAYGEKVVLNNTKGRNYFWRKAAKNDTSGFVDYVARERIPFTNPNIDRVNMLGFVQLPGKTNLIWDIKNAADAESLQYVEFGWENNTGDAVFAWNIYLKRNETKKVRFRVITVKGLSRFDAVSEDMVVGYGIEGKDKLRIEMAPLSPLGISQLYGEIVNAHNKHVLIKQSSELAEMQPFTPGRMEWRSTAVFERSASYPINMTLHSKEGKLLLKSDGVIAP